MIHESVTASGQRAALAHLIKSPAFPFVQSGNKKPGYTYALRSPSAAGLDSEVTLVGSFTIATC